MFVEELKAILDRLDNNDEVTFGRGGSEYVIRTPEGIVLTDEVGARDRLGAEPESDYQVIYVDVPLPTLFPVRMCVEL